MLLHTSRDLKAIQRDRDQFGAGQDRLSQLAGPAKQSLLYVATIAKQHFPFSVFYFHITVECRFFASLLVHGSPARIGANFKSRLG